MEGSAVDASTLQARGHDAVGMDAGAACVRRAKGIASLAHLDFLVWKQRRLVATTNAARQYGVAVGQALAGFQGFVAGALQEHTDAGARNALLLSFVPAASHVRSSRTLYISGGAHRIVQRAANAWDRFYRYHEAPWRGERDLEKLRPWLDGSTVLEFGCGNGKLLRPLRSAGEKVIGLDISWHAVRRVQRKVVLADASVLPFADGSFSAVMDIHCTGHLLESGRQAAMQECFRVLRPGGHLVMRRLGPRDLRADKGDPVEGDVGTRMLQDGRTTHFTHEEELVTQLKQAGFAIAHKETIVHRPRLRSERVTRQNVQVVGRKPLDF